MSLDPGFALLALVCGVSVAVVGGAALCALIQEEDPPC